MRDTSVPTSRSVVLRRWILGGVLALSLVGVAPSLLQPHPWLRKQALSSSRAPQASHTRLSVEATSAFDAASSAPRLTSANTSGTDFAVPPEGFDSSAVPSPGPRPAGNSRADGRGRAECVRRKAADQDGHGQEPGSRRRNGGGRVEAKHEFERSSGSARHVKTTLIACDANVSVKAATTTCPFAENVFYEFGAVRSAAEPPTSRLSAPRWQSFSPSTAKTATGLSAARTPELSCASRSRPSTHTQLPTRPSTRAAIRSARLRALRPRRRTHLAPPKATVIRTTRAPALIRARPTTTVKAVAETDRSTRPRSQSSATIILTSIATGTAVAASDDGASLLSAPELQDRPPYPGFSERCVQPTMTSRLMRTARPCVARNPHVTRRLAPFGSRHHLVLGGKPSGASWRSTRHGAMQDAERLQPAAVLSSKGRTYWLFEERLY